MDEADVGAFGVSFCRAEAVFFACPVRTVVAGAETNPPPALFNRLAHAIANASIVFSGDSKLDKRLEPRSDVILADVEDVVDKLTASCSSVTPESTTGAFPSAGTISRRITKFLRQPAIVEIAQSKSGWRLVEGCNRDGWERHLMPS